MNMFSGPLTAFKRCPMKAQCATFCGATLTTGGAGVSLLGVQATLLDRLGGSLKSLVNIHFFNFLLFRTYQRPSTTQTDSLWSHGTYYSELSILLFLQLNDLV